jgi:hypothetical protein
MELVTFLQLLRERRVLVAIGVLLALAAGLLVGRASHDAGDTSRASAQMVLDTKNSQLVEAAPDGASMLPVRAFLLADTLATDSGRALIARAAGVPEKQLDVLGPSATGVPVVDSPLVTQVAGAVSDAGAPYVVNAVVDQVTPMILILANAPDGRTASKLATAAQGTLRSLLVHEDGHQTRGFALRTTSAVEVTPIPGASRRRLMMVAAAAFVFGLWCTCIVLIAGTRQRLARERSIERSPVGDALLGRDVQREPRLQ